LPLIAVGAFALGLQLVGYVNVTSNGTPLAILIAASGLGLLLSTAWAATLHGTPASSPWAAGSSLPTASCMAGSVSCRAIFSTPSH
jgi:hypothetical protein